MDKEIKNTKEEIKKYNVISLKQYFLIMFALIGIISVLSLIVVGKIVQINKSQKVEYSVENLLVTCNNII